MSLVKPVDKQTEIVDYSELKDLNPLMLSAPYETTHVERKCKDIVPFSPDYCEADVDRSNCLHVMSSRRKV